MSLSSRLQTLKKFETEKKVKTPPPAPEKSKMLFPDWTEIHPQVWERTTTRPFPMELLPDRRWLAPADRNLDDFLFYDTETTGLSGGAGTMVFLIGWGRYSNGQLKITQLFLSDYPGEPALLNHLHSHFSEEKLFVSYNGRSFDSHLLRNRFLMNRMIYNHGRELDLLYTARRLWKGLLPACNLGQIETSVLKKKRSLDIPGEEIPQVWFDYLQTGPSEKLEEVFAHHLEDIASLAELYLVMETLPEKALSHTETGYPFNCMKLALTMMERKDVRGLKLLEQNAAEGDKPSMRALSLLLKKENRLEEAASLWKELNRSGKNIFAAVELAKYLEHRKKDYQAAIQCVKSCLECGMPLSREQRDALVYRLHRLERKINLSAI